MTVWKWWWLGRWVLPHHHLVPPSGVWLSGASLPLLDSTPQGIILGLPIAFPKHFLYNPIPPGATIATQGLKMPQRLWAHLSLGDTLITGSSFSLAPSAQAENSGKEGTWDRASLIYKLLFWPENSGAISFKSNETDG